jgi:hypothetical protein
MAPEGMVHALEIVHQLLAPGGLLIDIHPTSEPPTIHVRHLADEFLAGWLQETDDFIEYRQANQAMQQAIQRGWFSLVTASEFTFAIHAGSLDELSTYLAAEWKDAVIPTEAATKIGTLFSEYPQEKEIIITERIHIARYRRID